MGVCSWYCAAPTFSLARACAVGTVPTHKTVYIYMCLCVAVCVFVCVVPLCINVQGPPCALMCRGARFLSIFSQALYLHGSLLQRFPLHLRTDSKQHVFGNHGCPPLAAACKAAGWGAEAASGWRPGATPSWSALAPVTGFEMPTTEDLVNVMFSSADTVLC